jgi:hypothetical protein
MTIFNRLRRRPGRGEIDDLESVKSRLEVLPHRFPATATAVGPGAQQAKEQIPIICRNVGDAVSALRTGRDPGGNSITGSRVGNGLQRLANDASGPAFSGLMLTALSTDGVRELEGLIDELVGIAARLQAD